MSRRPRIPTKLSHRPFSLDEARAAGLTKSSLKGSTWKRLGKGLYRWNGLPEDPWQVLKAWRDSLPAGTLFDGTTAAWISVLDFKATNPVEIVVPRHSGVRSRPGLSARHCEIPDSDATTVRGLRSVNLHRTLCDLCLRWSAEEVLIAIDMALHRKRTNATSLARYAQTAGGRAGARMLRAPAALVAHNRPQNLRLGDASQLLRFTSSDIYNQPDLVEAQVRRALEIRPHLIKRDRIFSSKRPV